MGNDREVAEDRRNLAIALDRLIDGLKVIRLIDRDDRSDDEIDELRKMGVRVLSRRNLESYENGGDKLVHGSGGISQPRAA